MDIHIKWISCIARRALARQYSKVLHENLMNFEVTDSKQLLTEMEMPYKEGYTCLISNCNICSKKTSGNLFINKTTGFYMCEKCQCRGEWAAFKHLLLAAKTKKHLSKSDLQDLKSSSCAISSKKNNFDSLTSVSDIPKEELKVLLQKLNLPLVDPEVIQQLGVCVDTTHSSLYFPFRTTDSIITGTAFKVMSDQENDDVNYRDMEGSGLLVVRPEMNKNAAWRSRLVKSVPTAVLVPSVADALALVCAGVKQHIVCLPKGVSLLPIDVLPQLEQYSKIIFWFGDCDGVWDAVRNFSKKLDESRCFVVKSIPSAPNARTAFDSGLDVLKMILEAKPLYIEAVTSFKGLREDVFAELQNVGRVEGVKWKRFPLLNHLLKGFRRGELTVLSGSTGCGKTTFMSQYSLDLAEQGINTLWGSFEIPNHRLARIMLTQMAGVSLIENMDRFNMYADRLENLPIYFLKLHGQHASDKVLKVVDHATYVYDIGHVIIDTVQFMMGVSQDTSSIDRFWRQDNIIAGFRSFATTCNCHVTLIIHPRKERPGENLHLNSVFGGAKATQEADNVFMIQDERENNGQIFLKVLKNRYCGDLGRIPLEFNKINLSFAQKTASPQFCRKSESDHVHESEVYKQRAQKQWW